MTDKKKWDENKWRTEEFGLRPRAGDGVYEATFSGYLKCRPEHRVFVRWGSDAILFTKNEHLPVTNQTEAYAAASLFDHADRARRWNAALRPVDETSGPNALREDLRALRDWLRAPGTFGIGQPKRFSHHGEWMGRYAIGGLMQSPSFCPISPNNVRFTSYPLKNLPDPPGWYRLDPVETYVEALQNAILRVFEECQIVNEWNGGQSFILNVPFLHPKLHEAFRGHGFRHQKDHFAPAPPVGRYKKEAQS